eukprot:3831988-Amphidinium_carterae.1
MKSAHGSHASEPAPGKRSLETVGVDAEFRDFAHRSDATLWKRSFKAVLSYEKYGHAWQHL